MLPPAGSRLQIHLHKNSTFRHPVKPDDGFSYNTSICILHYYFSTLRTLLPSNCFGPGYPSFSLPAPHDRHFTKFNPSHSHLSPCLVERTIDQPTNRRDPSGPGISLSLSLSLSLRLGHCGGGDTSEKIALGKLPATSLFAPGILGSTPAPSYERSHTRLTPSTPFARSVVQSQQ